MATEVLKVMAARDAEWILRMKYSGFATAASPQRRFTPPIFARADGTSSSAGDIVQTLFGPELNVKLNPQVHTQNAQTRII
jgi:hypothetical protein